jgi:predicted DNA-binding transcriptional regulator YafY
MDDAVHNTLREAIEDQRPVKFDYTPVRPEKGEAGNRTVEPHALGLSKKAGQPILRAWVQRGASYTGLDPDAGNWRLFRVNNIAHPIIQRRRPRFEARPKFNPNDKRMRNVPRRITVRRIARRSARQSTRQNTTPNSLRPRGGRTRRKGFKN